MFLSCSEMARQFCNINSLSVVLHQNRCEIHMQVVRRLRHVKHPHVPTYGMKVGCATVTDRSQSQSAGMEQMSVKSVRL